jgi:hypothetical protein
MIKQLHQMGVRSDHAYIAGFSSIGLTWLAWTISRLRKSHDRSQSDRWGIFVSVWPPTMFAVGLALRLEENEDEKS